MFGSIGRFFGFGEFGKNGADLKITVTPELCARNKLVFHDGKCITPAEKAALDKKEAAKVAATAKAIAEATAKAAEDARIAEQKRQSEATQAAERQQQAAAQAAAKAAEQQRQAAERQKQAALVQKEKEEEAALKTQIAELRAKQQERTQKLQAVATLHQKQAAYGRDIEQKRSQQESYATESERLMGGRSGYYARPAPTASTVAGLGESSRSSFYIVIALAVLLLYLGSK